MSQSSEDILAAVTGGHPKRYLDGTHRSCRPADSLARLGEKLRWFGITRVADVTGLDRLGIPVVSVMRPNARSLAVSQGKASDPLAARISGIMESIELYHAEHITAPLKYARYSELAATAAVVDPLLLPRPAQTPFHADLPILWISGYDVANRAPVFVPFEAVSIDATYPEPPGAGSFLMTSNGIASGNSLAEAIGHGLCELIERDATTLWHRASEAERRERIVDPDTVNDAACIALLERLENAGILVAIDDLTSDLGVPTFQCTIVEDSNDEDALALTSAGMGTHVSRGVALSRAITEAAQSRLTLIAGSRDDVFRDEYVVTPSRAALAQRLIDRVKGGGERRPFTSIPQCASDDLGSDNATLIERLVSAGARNVVVVDLRDERWGECVVRAIVPGLEGTDKAGGYVAGPRALRVAAA